MERLAWRDNFEVIIGKKLRVIRGNIDHLETINKGRNNVYPFLQKVTSVFRERIGDFGEITQRIIFWEVPSDELGNCSIFIPLPIG